MTGIGLVGRRWGSTVRVCRLSDVSIRPLRHSSTLNPTKETNKQSPIHSSPAEDKGKIGSLLQSASNLFTPNSILSSPVWLSRTQKATERIVHTNPLIPSSKPQDFRIRIGIVGNSLSGSESLLRVLLDDPLKEDAQGGSLVQKNDPVQRDDQAIPTLAWLRDANVEFLQLINPTSSQANRSTLYECDMLIFVVDEITLAAHQRFGKDLKVDNTLQLLRYFSQKPNTKVLINHSGNQISDAGMLEEGLRSAIGQQYFASLTLNPILHASLSLAQRANDSLRQALIESSPNSPGAADWDHFTTLFSSSGFSDVRSMIEDQAKAQQNGNPLMISTAAFSLNRALEQAQFSIRMLTEHAQEAQGAAKVLRDEVDGEVEGVLSKIFHDHHPSDIGNTAVHLRAGDRSKIIEAAAKDAWGEVERAFSARLPWWKVVWKVDDVRAEIEAAINRGYAKDLERRLMVQTGRLMSIAERLQSRVNVLFRTLSDNAKEEQFSNQVQNPFASPLLLNDLRKFPLKSIENRLQEEDLLTKPIITRRDQLLASGGPVDVLCRRAQSNTVKTVGLTGTTALVTLAGGLAGSSTLGQGMPQTFQLIAMQPSTALASFGLVSILAALFIQTKWTRAKKRFWLDWQRISEGLNEDVRSNVEKVFDEIISGQSQTAIVGLENISKEYQIQIQNVHVQVQQITNQFKEMKSSS